MASVITPDRRRILKLTSFFEPYTSFSIRVRPGLETPVELISLKDPRNPTRERFVVHVHPALLAHEAPDWIEGAILGHALSSLGASSRKSTSSEDATRSFSELERYFRTKVAPRATPLVRLAPPTQQELFEVPGIQLHPESDTWKPTIVQSIVTVSSEVTLSDEREPLLGVVASFEQLPDKDALVELWRRIRRDYFPDREEIDSYRVVWSEREHTSTLASCNPVRRRVSVARAMKQPGALPHLEALLYHEMCHAVLGKPEVRDGRRIIHGKDFKQLEVRHSGIPALDQWIKEGGWRDAVRAERRGAARNGPNRPPTRRKVKSWRRAIRSFFGG